MTDCPNCGVLVGNTPHLASECFDHLRASLEYARSAASEARLAAFEEVAKHLESKCFGKWSTEEVAKEIRALTKEGT